MYGQNKMSSDYTFFLKTAIEDATLTSTGKLFQTAREEDTR